MRDNDSDKRHRLDQYRDDAVNRRTFRQVKRLFFLAGIIEAERSCSVRVAFDLFIRRSGERVSERQIRRDLILLTELGVLEETYEMDEHRTVFRYTFEGWPIGIH